MDRRRKSTYAAHRKKGSLVLCIAVVIATNIFMLIYYVLNPTRQLLNSVFPVGFILSRLIIIVVFCIILLLVILYNLLYIKVISVINISLIVIEIIFGFYFVFLLVIKVDRLLDQYYYIDSPFQEKIENLYNCCFGELHVSNVMESVTISLPSTISRSTTSTSPISTLLTSPTSTLSTSTQRTSTTPEVLENKSTISNVKRMAPVANLKSFSPEGACSHCLPVVKEQIRNIATFFSTGFIFNEIFMCGVTVLMVAQLLKI